MCVRHALMILAVLAMAAVTSASQMHHKEDLSHDLSLASFLEIESSADAAFDSALLAEVGSETHAELTADEAVAVDAAIVPAIVVSSPPRSGRDLGIVLAGGVYRGPNGPDMSKSSDDGETLAPYDPFRIEMWHAKRLAWRQKEKQKKVDLISKLEALQATAARTKRRLAQEAIEIAEEKARIAAEAAKKKAAEPEVETDLMEISAETEAESEVDVDAESDAEIEAEAQLLADMDAEAAVDAEEEAAEEIEATVDAEQETEDLAEAKADIEDGADVDVFAEFESEEDNVLAELSAEPAAYRPSDYVTYGREDLADEKFNNAGGRSVFARRQRGKEIIKFSKLSKSSGGNAVVNGVTKLPCGKEVTDKGLFAAAVSENLGTATVEAANPAAPIRVDENIEVIRALPVVPQTKAEQKLDQYGDMNEEE